MDSPNSKAKKSSNKPQISPARAKLLSVVLFLLLTLSVGFIGGWLGAGSRGQQSSNMTKEAAQKVALSESTLISNIAKDVGPSVVSISAVSQDVSNDFFGLPRTTEQELAGTGIILSTDGVVLTNRHVVPQSVNAVTITLSDGTELSDVEVIGRTNESDPLDVAFLKIKDSKGKDLKAAKLGDSAQMQVGDRVIAIGNALGQFQNTVTQGIISGYGRSVVAQGESSAETLQNLFQTDAAINQGNSGGPLVNVNGEVIGINTAVAGSGAENIGFAIPINDVKGLVAGVLETGKFERPYLGVRYVSLTDDLAYQLNLDTKRGAYIVPSSSGRPSILPDSPAAKAGLQEKDIITKVDGTPVDENNSLTALLGKHKVGDEVTLTIVRDGKEQEVKVKLEAQPQD